MVYDSSHFLPCIMTNPPISGQCHNHIHAFLRNRQEIPEHFRIMLRDIAEFCPEASCLSKELALHCFLNRNNNYVCPYHTYLRKGSNDVNDHNPPLSHKVTGIPQVRNVNQGKTEAPIVRSRKVFHCGCFEDDVLIDFWWWKNSTLKSLSKGIEEPWCSYRLDPYSRGFMVKWWKDTVHLNVNDIYSTHPQPDRRSLSLVNKLIHRLESVKKELTEIIQNRAVDSSESTSGSDSDLEQVFVSFTVLYISLGIV